MKHNCVQKKESGFTLVEAIIYVALFVLLSSLLVDSIVVLSKGYNDVRVNRDLLDSESVAVERMTRDIRGASSWVSGSASVFGTSPGKLTIKNPDSTTEVFQLVSGAVQLTDSTGYVSNLTGSQVSVNSLTFANISTTNGSAIKIDMSISSLRYSPSKTITISDTVVLRGSY